MSARDRVILSDCCEDWILEWGGFYDTGREFACPESDTRWAKTGTDEYRRDDGRTFVRRERGRGGSVFPFLAAGGGDEPIVDRCCATVLLRYGERMQDGSFSCPVCATEWQRRTERLHGLRVPVFSKAGLAEPLAVQPGRTRPFLVAVSEYAPPRDAF